PCRARIASLGLLQGSVECARTLLSTRALGRVLGCGLQSEQFPQTLGLRPAHRNFGLLFVVHAQLVGTLELWHYFANAVNIHKIGTVHAPEEIEIERVEQFLECPAIRLSLNSIRPRCKDADHAVFNKNVTDVFLIYQEQPSCSLDKNLRCGGLLRL